jgi:hypothetical protein
MRKSLEITELIVNPDNYRFDPVDTKEQAFDLMLEEKGSEIFRLAKHILEKGLDQARDFRVIKAKDGYLVLDGNRRITALKCLYNKSLIKDEKLRKKFDGLKIDTSVLPKTVSSFVYESEAAAADWIKLDHTGKNDGVGQDSWESSAVDRFGFKFEGKLSPAMQALILVERENNKKFDTKKLKISTINRIFSNPESRTFLGIDIKDKKINLTTSKKEAVKRIDKLFEKVINEDIKVDEVYRKEKSIDFMKKLFGSKPPQNKIVVLNLKDGLGRDGRKTQRTKSLPIVFFGKKLFLKNGDTNNLYRDIVDLFNFYENSKQSLSKNFCSLIRMSLRLIVESATNKKIDDYIHTNFDAAKKILSQDEKTTLSTQGVETAKKLIQLLHVGAHKYTASSNMDQTIAMSVIIGAMLSLSHSKKI